MTKLNTLVDTYLYISRNIDPEILRYLNETEQAVSFYYSVENSQTGIKVTFAIIYIIVVTLLLFLSIGLLISCESTVVEKSAGVANSEGAKYIFGSEEDNQIAIDLVLAYADKNTDLMYEMMTDTVRYWPSQGGEMMVLSRDAVHDVVNQLHSPYDSISRNVWNAVPLVTEGTDYTRVTVAFSESRYLKDGTQENVRLIDRIFLRDGKIFRIHQWDAEME